MIMVQEIRLCPKNNGMNLKKLKHRCAWFRDWALLLLFNTKSGCRVNRQLWPFLRVESEERFRNPNIQMAFARLNLVDLLPVDYDTSYCQTICHEFSPVLCILRCTRKLLHSCLPCKSLVMQRDLSV